MVDKAIQNAKKEVLKDIILGLHKGVSATEAKDRFEKEIGSITSTEIAELEQGLINEGLAPDDIKKFCNVHALIFQSALEKTAAQDTNPAHPIYLFKLENREIEKLLNSMKALIGEKAKSGFPAFKKSALEMLRKLKEIEKHYARKEQLLFPYLEKYGFMGPSKVMWAKDNEVRELLRAAIADLEKLGQAEGLEHYLKNGLDPLISEVKGMIDKEELILFPTSLEKLKADDWVDILTQSDEVGYVFIQKPEEADVLVKTLKAALCEEALFQNNLVTLPSGSFSLNEMMYIFNTLPVDVTFVDKDDTVRYFAENKNKIFLRPKAVIGRKVQNCHPPQSLHVVEKILSSFKEGKRDSYSFRINYQGKYVLINYYAVRDSSQNYLGTIEVTQDIAKIVGLQGEKRLLDETPAEGEEVEPVY